MNTKKFSEAMSEVDDKYYVEAANYQPKRRKSNWVKWGAVAACLTLVLAIGIPYITNLVGSHGGQIKDPLRPLNVIEYNGAYYEKLDMSDTELLDRYNLPHEITSDIVGRNMGSGTDSSEKSTEDLFQYLPYENIATSDGRVCRAVYIIQDGANYSFVRFCNYVHFDSNSHEEATELFAVYGIDAADDIKRVTIGNDTISDTLEIQAVFDEIKNAHSIGNDDYQAAIYGGLTEDEQRTMSRELAENMIEIRIETTSGVVTNHLSYYPSINYLEWGLSYYADVSISR